MLLKVDYHSHIKAQQLLRQGNGVFLLPEKYNLFEM